MKKFEKENECYNYIIKSEFKELASDSSFVGGFEAGFNHALEQFSLHNAAGQSEQYCECKYEPSCRRQDNKLLCNVCDKEVK